jgi:pimeloyl-ACP methyl ester carboxylesterase
VEVPVGGGSLHVAEVGAGGMPVLLIQGLGHSHAGWRFQLDAFGARRRTIAFDNRGTGRSSKEPGPYSMEQFADDAVAVLDALGVESAHVVGLSMGGFVAQLVGLRAPERVTSLVLVGTSPGGPQHAPVPAETLDAWTSNAHLPPEDFARRTMHLSFSEGWAEAHPELCEEMIAARLEHPTPPECWRAQFVATGPYLVAGVPVEEIAAPVLVVHGDADRVVPLSNGLLLARRIPGAELVVVPGCGHVVQLEAPDEFNSLVESFFERVERTAAPVPC